VPELERELRCSGKRVAALIHRRRARMGRLAAPDDTVTLDPEGSEDSAEREVHGLQHRALLDVQLEVRGGVVQLLSRVDGPVEFHAVSPDRRG
jgi:hypothetical protein